MVPWIFNIALKLLLWKSFLIMPLLAVVAGVLELNSH